MKHTCGPWQVGGWCGGCTTPGGGIAPRWSEDCGPGRKYPGSVGGPYVSFQDELETVNQQVHAFDLDVQTWAEGSPAREAAFAGAWTRWAKDWDMWFHKVNPPGGLDPSPASEWDQAVVRAFPEFKSAFATLVSEGKGHGVQTPVKAPQSLFQRSKGNLEAALPWLGGAATLIGLFAYYRHGVK